MDHVPYPVSTSVPPVEVPLLVHGSSRDAEALLSSIEQTDEPDLDGTPTKSRSARTGGVSAEARTRDPPHHTTGSALEADLSSIADWTVEFLKYPEQQGWSLASTRSWWTSCPEETARRAQEWMYFELLRRFLGEPIDLSSLFRRDTNSGKEILDSRILPKLLKRWVKRQSASEHNVSLYTGTISAGTRRESIILSLLARVVLECNKLNDLLEPSKSTALAINVLVETLMIAICNLAQVEITETRAIQKLQHNFLLEERFLSNGWCPFQLARLWGRYSPSTTYYLSSLSREPTFGGVKHDQCDATRCMTTSIDPSTYEPQHDGSCSTESGACRMVGVQSSTVADCIKRGHIPLVKFEQCANGILRPEIIESRSDLRYVAISHVWSGGLGNVTANSMFSCQLRKLQGLLQKIRKNGDDDLDRDRGSKKTRGMKRDLRALLSLQPLPQQPILLWIDTLCVPVGSEHAQTRQMAIAQMAQIYVEAQCVLVVDPELQKMNQRDLPDEELFASVLCSSWNSRSWTFQEACMARVFYVQFLDGYSVVDKKWHDFIKHIDEKTKPDTAAPRISKGVIDMHDKLLFDVSDWFGTMPVMTKIRSYDARTLMTKSEDWLNFVRVWNGLRTRSTTKSDDLYGIIAIMVDLTAYEILRLDPQERMKAILRSQSTLPLFLLYQDCSRIHDAEGRSSWAPAQIKGGHLDTSGGYMSLHDDHLLIDMHKQGASRYSWPQIYRFYSDHTLPLSFAVGLANEPALSVRLYLPNGVNGPNLSTSWLILMDEAATYGQTTQVVPGALLSLNGTDGSTLMTSYICPLKITFDAPTSSVEKEEKPSGDKSSDHPLRAQSVSLKDTKIRIETGYIVTGRYEVAVSRTDVSDLPEDMTNYSRYWEENVKNSWLSRHVLKNEPQR
ncbi:MAG: hypothetical protein Q9166_003752 [cf. Caloplaca sp. 2 TL-2023]